MVASNRIKRGARRRRRTIRILANIRPEAQTITNQWVCGSDIGAYLCYGSSTIPVDAGNGAHSEAAVVLNKFSPSGHGEAQVQYLDGDFRVISPGSYVRCAVTDVRIPLDELKYWSVDLQEAYAMPNAVLQRHFPGALKAQG
jgi:hypothetical protein